MDKYLYNNKDVNGEIYDLSTIEYLVRTNNVRISNIGSGSGSGSISVNGSKENIIRGKITMETSEIRSFITKIIFRDINIYKLILEFINEYQKEIEMITEYRNYQDLFKFYIKGNMALMINLLKNGYYKDWNDPKIKFDPSDIDTNLFINSSVKNGAHLENITKSLSQKLFYKYRRILDKSTVLEEYLSEMVVNIANKEDDEIKKKYNIKNIKKIKLNDRLMYKKKGFVSRWKIPFDDFKHNIIVSFNETIEQFMLYRLFVPYIVEFEDGSNKIVNAELVDLSIVCIDPNLSLYKNPEMQNKIHDDVNKVIKSIKNNTALPVFGHKYHLEQLLWNKIIKEKDEYLVKIDYFDYNLTYASLKYLLYEYCLILINDPTDIKNPAKIEKIKIILDL
jgi:hypothetical protein